MCGNCNSQKKSKKSVDKQQLVFNLVLEKGEPIENFIVYVDKEECAIEQLSKKETSCHFNLPSPATAESHITFYDSKNLFFGTLEPDTTETKWVIRYFTFNAGHSYALASQAISGTTLNLTLTQL